MSVKSVVGGAAKTWWDDVAEKQCPNVVLHSIRLVLIKGDEDKSFVHEGGVVEKWRNERSSPITGIIDCCIVPIIQHVGSEKCPNEQSESSSDVDTIEGEFWRQDRY